MTHHSRSRTTPRRRIGTEKDNPRMQSTRDIPATPSTHTREHAHIHMQEHTHADSSQDLDSWIWSHSRAICQNACISSDSFYSESSGVCDCACVYVKKGLGNSPVRGIRRVERVIQHKRLCITCVWVDECCAASIDNNAAD